MSRTRGFAADWFNGIDAKPRPAEVELFQGELTLSCEGEVVLRSPLSAVEVSELGARLPVRVALPDGSALSVAAADEFLASLRGAGWREPIASRLQRRNILMLLLVVMVLAFGLYRYAVPAAAQGLAKALPASLEKALGDQIFNAVDGGLLNQSTVPPEVRARLRERLDLAAREAAPGLIYQLHFRRMPRSAAPNAFALPGGHVVLLDSLTESGLSDAALVAVLAHELGHVSQRHSTQALFKVAGVSILGAVVFGDWSSAAANVVGTIQFLEYSRDAEREADGFALRFLDLSGLGAAPMIEAFDLLGRWTQKRGLEPPPWLSSHPGIEERKTRIREWDARAR